MLINAKIWGNSKVFALPGPMICAVVCVVAGKAAFGLEEMRETSKASKIFFCFCAQVILTRTPWLWTIGVWGFGNA